MNRWKRMVLSAGPVTNLPVVDILATENDLNIEILIVATDEEVDFVEAAHRVLQRALGKRGFERSRRALFSAATWVTEDQRICRRLALQVCWYFCDSELATPEQLDHMMRTLLLTEAELVRIGQWQPGQEATSMAACNHRPC